MTSITHAVRRLCLPSQGTTLTLLLVRRHGPVVNIWSGTQPARLPSTTGESERSLQGRHLTLQDELKQSKQPASSSRVEQRMVMQTKEPIASGYWNTVERGYCDSLFLSVSHNDHHHHHRHHHLHRWTWFLTISSTVLYSTVAYKDRHEQCTDCAAIYCFCLGTTLYAVCDRNVHNDDGVYWICDRQMGSTQAIA